MYAAQSEFVERGSLVRNHEDTAVTICHITTVDISLEILLMNQLKSIMGEGYRVVGISSPGPSVPRLEEAKIRHISVPMTRRLSPFADLLSLWRLYRVMRREKFTIVHTHNPKPGLLGQLAARLAGVPIVINTVHGYYFHDRMNPAARRFYILMEKIASMCSDVILSQNKDDIKTALAESICPPGRIKHLGNGIDLTLFDPERFTQQQRLEKRAELGIPSDAKVVGFVGRLAKRKAFDDFLAAAERIRREDSNARFLVVGEKDIGKSDAMDTCEAANYDLGDSCHFIGQRPYEELPSLYSVMDVFVLPSPWEGVPRAAMEATAMEVPAVVTDVKGTRDVISEGDNGFLVAFGDVASLSERILYTLENRVLAKQLGKRGRAIALEKFDELAVFDRVKQEYRRLLEVRGGQ